MKILAEIFNYGKSLEIKSLFLGRQVLPSGALVLTAFAVPFLKRFSSCARAASWTSLGRRSWHFAVPHLLFHANHDNFVVPCFDYFHCYSKKHQKLSNAIVFIITKTWRNSMLGSISQQFPPFWWWQTRKGICMKRKSIQLILSTKHMNRLSYDQKWAKFPLKYSITFQSSSSQTFPLNHWAFFRSNTISQEKWLLPHLKS